MRAAKNRNSSGNTRIMAARISADTDRRATVVDCSTTNIKPRASSSEAMALALIQNRSPSDTPSEGSESRIKPVDGVKSASAMRAATRHDTESVAWASAVVRTRRLAPMARCCSSTRVSRRSSSRSTSRPAKRNSAAMPRAESNRTVGSSVNNPNPIPATAPRARAVTAAGSR